MRKKAQRPNEGEEQGSEKEPFSVFPFSFSLGAQWTCPSLMGAPRKGGGAGACNRAHIRSAETWNR